MKGYTFFVQTVKFLIQNFIKFLHNFQYSQYSTQDEFNFKLKSTFLSVFILILFNKVFFAFSAFKLYNILTKTVKHEANLTILFYIYNPGFIFFNCIYSQSLFCFIIFSAIDFYLESCQQQTYQYVPLKTILLLIFSISIRSNGIFLIAIIGLPLVIQFFNNLISQQLFKTIKTFLYGLLMISLFSLPIILYSLYLYLKLCKVQQSFIKSQSLAQECRKFLPNLYSYIQNKYWTVGFLEYYKLNNLVFILIGIPSLMISLVSFYKAFQILINKNNLRKSRQIITMAGFYLSFWILLGVSIFFANVQSSTRFLCSHPVFYICLSTIAMNKSIKIWTISYYGVGTILFYLCFPWT